MTAKPCKVLLSCLRGEILSISENFSFYRAEAEGIGTNSYILGLHKDYDRWYQEAVARSYLEVNLQLLES